MAKTPLKKLYSTGSGDLNASLVKVTARILDIEYVEIDVTATVKPAAGGQAPAGDKKEKASKGDKKDGGKTEQ